MSAAQAFAVDSPPEPLPPRPVPPQPGRGGWPATAWQDCGVVLGAFLCLLVGFGAIYSYGAFAEELAADFGTSRSEVARVYALSGGSCFMVSAITGRLADRVSAALLAATGMVMVGAGLSLAAAARSVLELQLSYGLLVGLGTGFAYVPAMAVVQRCFTVHRGLASGIAVSGSGIGTALLPLLTELSAQHGGWRWSFLVFGWLAVALGLAGAALLRHPAACRPADAKPAWILPPAYGRRFAMIYCGMLLVSVPASLPHAMLVITALDRGLDHAEAVWLLGLVGLGSIGGRFLLAAIADAVGRRVVFLACCGGMALAMPVWALAADRPALQAFAIAFGALQGGFVALLPPFATDIFGVRAVGSVLGILHTGRGLALLLAPLALTVCLTALPGVAIPLIASGAIGLIGTRLLAVACR